MTRILICLSLIFLISSCSPLFNIEKRKYRDGYHIEWLSHKKSSTPESEDNSSKPNFSCADSFAIELMASSSSEKNIVVQKNIIPPIVFASDTLPEKKKHLKKHDAPMKDDDRKDVGKREHKINPWGIVGFVFSILALSMLPFISYAAYIPAIIGFVFSMMGVAKVDYKGRGYALAGLVISILVVFVLTLMLL